MNRFVVGVLACLSFAPVSRAENSRSVTLSVHQGIRLSDAAVTGNGQPCDVRFDLVEPTPGGLAPQFNGLSREMEWRPGAKIDRNTPVLVGTRMKAFTERPSLDAFTTGDLAACDDSLLLSSRSHDWLVQDAVGDAYLLHGDAQNTDQPEPSAWKWNVTIEKVSLPLGESGGKINPPLPGKLLFRSIGLHPKATWCDLPSGQRKIVADGLWPTASAERSIAVGKSGQWVVQDGDDEIVAQINVQPELLDAALSPDGKLLAGTSKIPTRQKFLDMEIPGPDRDVVRVIGLDGKEVARFDNAVDAAWSPDGQLLAAPVEGNGLYRCDLSTGQTAPLGSINTNAGEPALSTDGRQLAYVSNGRVFITALSGGKPASVFKDPAPQRSPAFSPDGRYLALISGTTIRVIDLTNGTLITPISRAGWPLETDNNCRLTWVK